MQKRPRSVAGFSLIEVLVALTVIGVLVALLLPAVQAARASARRMQCQNQMRQLGLALHGYHNDHQVFPSGSYVMGQPEFPMQTGWGWGAMILPYIDQGSRYQQIDFNLGTAVDGNLSLIGSSFPFWICPMEIAPERLHVNSTSHAPYDISSGNYCGSDGILDDMSSTRMSNITDGMSQTLLVGERIVQSGLGGTLAFTSPWFGQVAFIDNYEYRCIPHLLAIDEPPFSPLNRPNNDPHAFGSRHPGGAYFVLCDGSIRFLSQNIDGSVFEALGTPAGGEVVGLP